MIQDVWFKRDLRVRDNEVLASATEQGPVLPLYIAEPDLWRQPDSSSRRHRHSAAKAGTFLNAMEAGGGHAD